MQDCIFCKILTNKEPAKIVFKDKNTIAFLPLEMNTKGHLIVAPTKHYQDIFDNLSSLIQTVQLLAKHLKNKLNAQGVNILHASGKAAQQSVFHFHIHLIPRFKNDSINTWPNLPKWKGDVNELLEIIKLS